MSWLSRNAPHIEAVAATVTAIVAIAAVIGVKIQLDAADDLQKAQSARDAYRAHLSLAVANPAFAQPDVCRILAGPQAGSYAAFVDHLLYSAEQMLDASDGWDATFTDQLTPHSDYLCSNGGPIGETEDTIRLLTEFRAAECPATPTCG